MKKIYLAILIICISNLVSAQNFAWAKSFGGNNNDAGRVTCTDAAGNVFVAGSYFAPSMLIGSVTVNSLGGGDVFVSKWDPNGNLIWVQNIGGTGLETVGGICTATNGGVFICGSYDSPVLTVSTATLGQNSTLGNHDIYVANFSSGGSCMWANRYGNTGNDVAKGITYSSALNNVIFTGYFNSSTIAFGTTTLTNTGTNYDVFVAKLTPGFTNANPAGAFATGAANANDYGYSVRVDATSIYLGGAFSPVTGNSSTIGSAVTSYGSQDVFIAKYSNANVFQWVRTGGSASTSADYFTSMDIDASSNCYIVGAYFSLPMVLGTTTLTNGGGNDAFIAKYNSAGTLQWANKLSGASQEFNNDVTVDSNNDAYVTGYYSSTVSTTGTLTLSNPSSTAAIQNVYVIKYAGATGNPLWAATSSGVSQSSAYGITNDAIGNIYFTGAHNLQASVAFGTNTILSTGQNDGFLTRIHCSNPTITGASNVCTGSSATLIGTGATSYTWSNGATTTSIVITPTANTTFTIIGNSGACTSPNSTPFSVTLLPVNVNAGTDFSLMCNATGVMNPTCNPSSTSVQWSPATGLSSTTILSPTVTSPNSSQSYVLTATLTNGCVGTDTVTVSHDVAKPDICIVTCDSLNVNNEIFWDKLAYPLLDSMIIYREVSANIYKRIGAVPSNSISLFTDTIRSVGPANGDPKITTYRYKIQQRDICGAYGPMSLWHNTIFFTRTGSTFFWINNYMIEGPTNPVNTYSLLVCPNPTVSPNYQLIGTTAGNQNQLNDPAYATYSATADWRVVGDLGYVCYAQKTAQQGKSTPVTRSNISNNRAAAPDIGVREQAALIAMNIYPNPAQKFVTVDAGSLTETAHVKIVDALGKLVLSDTFSEKKTLDVSNLAPGIYILKVNYKGSEYTHKLVID